MCHWCHFTGSRGSCVGMYHIEARLAPSALDGTCSYFGCILRPGVGDNTSLQHYTLQWRTTFLPQSARRPPFWPSHGRHHSTAHHYDFHHWLEGHSLACFCS